MSISRPAAPSTGAPASPPSSSRAASSRIRPRKGWADAADAFVLDGEVVIAGANGLDFEALQQRIHPAASRIALLARETPAEFVAFDLLATAAADLTPRPQADRRRQLEQVLGRPAAPLHLTPSTTDRAVATDWFARFEGAGLEGVIANPAEAPYRPGERVMLKIKHQRTVECVV